MKYETSYNSNIDKACLGMPNKCFLMLLSSDVGN